MDSLTVARHSHFQDSPCGHSEDGGLVKRGKEVPESPPNSQAFQRRHDSEIYLLDQASGLPAFPLPSVSPLLSSSSLPGFHSTYPHFRSPSLPNSVAVKSGRLQESESNSTTPFQSLLFLTGVTPSKPRSTPSNFF